MKKYFLTLAVALTLLSVKGQNVFHLIQIEKDDPRGIKYVVAGTAATA